MALKTACFCMRPRAGTLFFLYLFLIESVLMMLRLGTTFVNSERYYTYTIGYYYFRDPVKTDYANLEPLLKKADSLVFYADGFIALMSVIFIAAIIYGSYNKPSITLLSVVNAVLLLELILKTYADFNYTFTVHWEESEDYEFPALAIQSSCIMIMFRIIFTLYAVLVIHGFTIELKNKANSATLPSVNFTDLQRFSQPPQYTA